MGSPIENYLKEKYGILKTDPVAHIHIETPISGVAFSAGVEQKLNLELVPKHIIEQGGWVYDNVLSRFTWSYDLNFVPVFAGTGSVKMTTGVNVILTFKLKLNGTMDILTTPSTFGVIDRIQQLAAIDLVMNGAPFIKKDDFVEVWAVCDGNATFDIQSFQIGLLGR